jgi:hypothetical protein
MNRRLDLIGNVGPGQNKTCLKLNSPWAPLSNQRRHAICSSNTNGHQKSSFPALRTWRNLHSKTEVQIGPMPEGKGRDCSMETEWTGYRWEGVLNFFV